MDPNEILDIARIIKASKLQPDEKKTVFAKEYEQFSTTYPVLFDVCCNNDSDMTKLEFMVKMLKKINANQMTQHVASAKVGQNLFDTFVQPMVDNGELGAKKGR